MATFSFDIVSEINKAEMNNVFLAVEKEISNRFDFRGTPASIEWLENKNGFKVTGSNDWQIEAIIDIIRKKLASREQSIKAINLNESINTSNMKATKELPFVSGLDQDKSKMITKIIRDKLPKIKTQIQGESIRVSSDSKDNLQQSMQLIRSSDLDFPVNFNNFR